MVSSKAAEAKIEKISVLSTVNVAIDMPQSLERIEMPQSLQSRTQSPTQSPTQKGDEARKIKQVGPKLVGVSAQLSREEVERLEPWRYSSKHYFLKKA